MSLPVSTFNAADSSANKLRHTYVKGFVDISGGDLNLQNGALHMYRGSNNVYFGISGDHFTTTSWPSLQRVDVSLSSMIHLNSISSNVDDTFSVINQRINGITYDLTFDRTVIDNSISANGIALFNSDVSINGNLLVYGNSSFSKYPVFVGAGNPTQDNQFVTKNYVDIYGGAMLIESNNTWTGNNYFSNYLPAWNGAGDSFPVSGNQFTVKSYVDNVILSGGGTVLLAANNVWSANNNFSTYLPTWTGVGGPVQGNQFATKDYVDIYGSALLLSSNNLFSGNNTFGGDVSINKTLIVGGDVSINKTLIVGGDVSINKTLIVGGDVSINKTLIVGGDVSINKTLIVGGDVSFNGNLRIGGAIFQQVPALGFDGGFPGTDFSITPKLDAGFYI